MACADVLMPPVGFRGGNYRWREEGGCIDREAAWWRWNGRVDNGFIEMWVTGQCY